MIGFEPDRFEPDDYFRMVFEQSPVGIAVGRTDGEIVYVNPTMCRLLGQDRESISVASFVDAAQPGHRFKVRRRLRSLQSGEFETFVRETTFRHADGTEVRVRFHVGATRAADGSITYLVAQAEDITESSRTEAALALSEDRFRAASEASLDSLILMDAVRDEAGAIVDFTITDANANASAMFGYSVEEMVGKRIDANFPVSYKTTLLDRYRRVVETGEPESAEYAAGDPSVKVLWIREQVVKVDDGIALTSSDISEQKHAEFALRASEERYRSLLQHAVDVVCIIDAGAYVRYASPAVEQVLGYTPEEFCGLHPFDLIHAEDLESWLERWHAIAGRADGRFRLEVRALHRDGGYRWMEVTVRDLRYDPHIGGFVAHFHDVGDRRAAQEALLHQSLHDGLTGLPNRALLLDRLAHAFDRSRRRSISVAVLFLDVDHFKAINDSLGHATGDALLREVAVRLRAAMRPEDSVARFGGDEFVVCCEDIEDVEAAMAVADRIREAFAAPFSVNGHTVRVGTSIGVALAGDTTETPESVLRDADAAMYVAKARGRDRSVVYDDALRTRVLEHLDTEAGLRDALDRDALVVHWQPLFDLRSHTVTGLEALVRWRHDERGLLLPAEFLEAAQLAGLDAPLGNFVLDTACRQLRAWDDLGVGPPVIWLNLSLGQLIWTGTVDRVRQALARHSIDPSRIGFDISEHTVAEIDRARRASAELSALRALGCAIAIDDFGTGHASPLAVRRYGITHVKLDRSLVQTAADGDPMLPALMSLASMLGVTVLAEGIETPDQLERILAAGCDTATGNFLAPAASEPETTAFLREQARGIDVVGRTA